MNAKRGGSMIEMRRVRRERGLVEQISAWGQWLQERFKLDLSGDPSLQERVDELVIAKSPAYEEVARLVDKILCRLDCQQLALEEKRLKVWVRCRSWSGFCTKSALLKMSKQSVLDLCKTIDPPEEWVRWKQGVVEVFRPPACIGRCLHIE